MLFYMTKQDRTRSGLFYVPVHRNMTTICIVYFTLCVALLCQLPFRSSHFLDMRLFVSVTKHFKVQYHCPLVYLLVMLLLGYV